MIRAPKLDHWPIKLKTELLISNIQSVDVPYKGFIMNNEIKLSSIQFVSLTNVGHPQQAEHNKPSTCCVPLFVDGQHFLEKPFDLFPRRRIWRVLNGPIAVVPQTSHVFIKATKLLTIVSQANQFETINKLYMLRHIIPSNTLCIGAPA